MIHDGRLCSRVERRESGTATRRSRARDEARPVPWASHARPERSELKQIVLEAFVRIAGPRQAAALQFRHQPVTDLDDIAPIETPVEEQETIAADFLHYVLHHPGDVIDRAGEIDARFGG